MTGTGADARLPWLGKEIGTSVEADGIEKLKKTCWQRKE
jgi:hypothetical protein